jgi:hypothetical protein
MGNRADTDPMSKDGDRLPHNEETHAKPPSLRGVDAREGFEDGCHMFAGNTDSSIQ